MAWEKSKMKKLLVLLLIFGVVGCDNAIDIEANGSDVDMTADTSEWGFVCEPKSSYGFDILIKYDGKFVSTFHDKIHLRPDGWVITELNSYNFEHHLNNEDYPIMEWSIPRDRYSEWTEKVHLHKVDGLTRNNKNELNIENWLTDIITIYKYKDSSEIKSMHSCFLIDTVALDNFVEDRKENLFD